MSKTILHLPKWFPNKFDSQNGIFVKKHICSVQDAYNQKVLYIFKDSGLPERVWVEETKEGNVTYYRVSFKSFGSTLPDVLMHGYLGVTYGLKYSKGVDLIHTHIMGRNVTIGWILSAIRSVKLVHTEHWSLFINPKQWKAKSGLYKRMTKFLFRKTAQVFAVSEPLNKQLKAIYPKLNSEIVGNVISENPYTSIEKHSTFTFVHISDLRDDIKNISGVIEAFKIFKTETHSSAQLHIVGDGEDRAMLEAKAKGIPDIQFLGRQSNSEVYKTLNASHCLLLNSKRETFGMVILEAFSCGLPVVCAKNGMSEYFVDQASGYTVDQNDTAGFANALKNIETNYDSYSSERLKEKAKPFSEVVIGNKIKRVYKQFIHET